MHMTTSPDTIPPLEVLEDVFERTYSICARDNRLDPDTIHRRPYCIQVTDIARRLLTDLQIPSFVIVQGDTVEYGYHKFVGLGSPTEPVLVDGTWQQFIPAYRHKINAFNGKKPPKVLMGEPTKFIELAKDYGVREAALGQWAIGPAFKRRPAAEE